MEITDVGGIHTHKEDPNIFVIQLPEPSTDQTETTKSPTTPATKKGSRSRASGQRQSADSQHNKHTRVSSITQLNLETEGFGELDIKTDKVDFHQRVNQILWPQQSAGAHDLDSSIADRSYADLVLDTEAYLDSESKNAPGDAFKFSRRMYMLETEINFGELVDVCPRQRSKDNVHGAPSTELPIEHTKRYLLGPHCSLSY